MVAKPIKVFARIKLEKRGVPEKLYDISNDDEINFYSNPYAHFTHSAITFRFHKVFDQNKSQNEIFLNVAKPVVNSVLQGFNGTIFAYGQTGSGKTYSITGSPKAYQDRGIIPRCIQDIFFNIEKTECKPVIYVSYMEIYNEICYDLLNAKDSKTAINLEELPRVIVLEDKKGEPILRNLSILPVSTEEEAMRLLFLGDTNRAIAETPLNDYSSRSHCIFTIYVTCRDKSSKTRFSKLNLVDLAGSERVYKSQITGTTLTEAKYINLSLHFLQQVILALSDSKRVHIPYRNSVMTFILKDSLAGNCVTVMLATLAVTKSNIQETISTCRFAQRVSMIKTEPVINKVYDPQQEIDMLRNEISQLRKQLTEKSNAKINFIRNKHVAEELTDYDKIKCKKAIDKYLTNPDEGFLNIEPNFAQIQYCFALLKLEVVNKEHTIKLPDKSNFHDYNLITNNFLTKTNTIDQINFIKHEEDSLTQELNYYTSELNTTYEKAKSLANAIEDCQKHICLIRKKLDHVHSKDFHQKILLTKELEYQQNIYKASINQLKEVKNETMHLQCKLKKAKLLNEQREYLPFHSQKAYNENKIQTIQCENICCSKKSNTKQEKYFLSQTHKNCSCSECTLNDHSLAEYTDCIPKQISSFKTNNNLICCKHIENLSKENNCGTEHFKPRQFQFEADDDSIETQNQLHCNCKDCQIKTNSYSSICFRPVKQLCKTSYSWQIENSELQSVPNKLSKLNNSNYLETQKGSCINESTCNELSFNNIPFETYSTPYDNLESFISNGTSADSQNDYDTSHTGPCKPNEFRADNSDNFIYKNSVFEHMKSMDCFDPNSKINDIYYNSNNNKAEKSHNSQSLLKTTDPENFIEFMKSIPLTGDFNIDNEICDFYRDKFC